MSARPPSSPQPNSLLKRLTLNPLSFAVGVGTFFLSVACGIVAGHFTPSTDATPPFLMRLKNGVTTPSTKSATNEKIANLAVSERQAIAQEILGIQSQLSILTARTQRLEAEVGLGPQRGKLGDRLDRLNQSLAGDSSPLQEEPSTLTDETLIITLPSSILFKSALQLSTDAADILDVVATDLEKQNISVITIASFMSQQADQEVNARAQEQAIVIQDYLAQVLDGEYRWVTAGYGMPVSETDAQRNQQRIEIISQ